MDRRKKRQKILLIGWDGADWQHITPLLEAGLLPNLEKFINQGVMGNLATLQPILSPMLWNSAVTGKHAYKHGIHGFVEPDRLNGGYRPFSSYSRKCKALWNIFSQQGLNSNVINWWASHPAESVKGCIVSNLINGVKFKNGIPEVATGTVFPEEKAAEYAQYKVHANELEAEQICAFIPLADQLNQDEDSRLQTFANVLAETLTTHAVGTAVMENEPWDFMAIYYTCIDHFGHAFMPYHPPRMPHIPKHDFEIFKDVVAGAYRFSDLMLGRLMQLAGEDAIVVLCSDHGFLSGSYRPQGNPKEPAGPAIWHRRYGVFLMQGPGIKQDERIYGASLIDIAPTILVAAGMPVAKDMDGRPLLEVFETAPEVEVVDSWEEIPGEFSSGMHLEEKPLDPQEAEDLVNQFVALGYIEDPVEDKDKQFISAEIECMYNLARNYMFVGRPEEAVHLLEELVHRSPWESRFIVQLIQACQKAGMRKQAADLIESAFDIANTKHLLIPIVWAELQYSLRTKRQSEIPEVLNRVEGLRNTNPVLLKRAGQLYAKMRCWSNAERVYLKALDKNRDDAEVWQGLARVYSRLGRNQESIQAALEAVGLVHRLPHAHLQLGIGLAKTGDPERAVVAFQTALQFSPGFLPAHRWLAVVYRNSLGKPDLAQKHLESAREYSRTQDHNATGADPQTARLLDLPELPNEAEREKRLNEERPDRVDPRRPSGKTFVIVSGLPRSGTSLMMQMLEAGGLPAKTDAERQADTDNPKGYFEWEAIKRVKGKPQIMLEEGLDRKAIKAVTMVLQDLPYAHNYKVIFMNRPIDEVVASQVKMIQRLETGDPQSSSEMQTKLERHRLQSRRRLEANPRVEVLDVNYPDLISEPHQITQSIVSFLGAERLPNAEAMHSVVDPSLYRQKSDT